MKALLPACPDARRTPPRRLARWAARAALAALVAGAAPAATQEARLDACDGILPADLRGICERQVLRVARYGGDRPPFFYLEGGAWVGFDVDLGRDMAARLGVAYEEDTSASSFDEVVGKVADGSADLAISKLSATLARAMKVRFSRPYLTVYQAMLVNRLAAPRATDPFRDLNAPKYSIGALAGSAYVGYARTSLGRAQVRPYDDFDTMMADVVRGDLYGVLMDSARANTWRRDHSDQLIQVRATIDKSRRDPLAIAVGWENTHLLAWVDLYLETIRGNGAAERLYARWFQAGAPGGKAPESETSDGPAADPPGGAP